MKRIVLKSRYLLDPWDGIVFSAFVIIEKKERKRAKRNQQPIRLQTTFSLFFTLACWLNVVVIFWMYNISASKQNMIMVFMIGLILVWPATHMFRHLAMKWGGKGLFIYSNICIAFVDSLQAYWQQHKHTDERFKFKSSLCVRYMMCVIIWFANTWSLTFEATKIKSY